MKITPYSLAILSGLSLVITPLAAQDSKDTPAADTDKASPPQEEKDTSPENTEKKPASEEGTGEQTEEETTEPETTEDEKSWQDRVIPSIAISGQEPAPEIIVGEPTASPTENPGNKVYLPYPPRPRSPLPPGWVLRPSDDLPAITRNVQLADGRRVILEFPAMEIQPEITKDGAFPMQEPGFDPRQTQQENTVSSALGDFIDDTKNHRKILGEAIREMEQILLSAPPAPPRPAPAANDGEPSSPLLPPSPPTR